MLPTHERTQGVAGTGKEMKQSPLGAERVEFCLQESLRGLVKRDWAGAMARLEELKQLIDGLTKSEPSIGSTLWTRYGDVMNTH
jgi:hypothetical protein